MLPSVVVSLAVPRPGRQAKTLPRLWLGDRGVAIVEGKAWDLDASQHQYISRVMRLRVGDEVRVFGAAMGEWIAGVTSSDRKGTRVAALRQTRPPLEGDGGDVELVFAPLRKKRTSLLIEKAVELGVTRLVPVRTSRTERASLAALSSGAHATAVEAAEQCERLDVPLLTELEDVSYLGRTPLPVFVCAERSGDSPHLLDALNARPAAASGVAIVVGPEGGFSDDDLDAILDARPDVTFCSLGESVLRAETAAWAALVLAQAAMRRR